MDRILSSWFPVEIADRIAREVHEKNMIPVLGQIKYCIVKIYTNGEGYGFLTSNNVNYFFALELEGFETGWGSDESLAGEVEGE